MTSFTKTFLLAILGLVLWAPAAAAQESIVPAGFELRNSALGFHVAAGMAYAPDGRIFVAEKEGRIRVSKADGSLPVTTVYDIRDRVNDRSDRGLLGLAVDKDFATNGYLYFVYVADLNPLNPDSADRMVSRLSRIKVGANNVGSEETVLLGTYNGGPCPAPSNTVDCIPADYYWHTIGTVRVDPVDGTLWLGSGEASPGSSATAAWSMRAQNEQSFAGKIIHIDRDGRGLPGHPMCPTETDLTKVCTKLYAKGFRNPFRFTLRPGKGPVVGDVGNTRQEELDLLKPGGNYGWPCYEGTIKGPGTFQGEAACTALYAEEGTPQAATGPNWSYAHVEEEGASITAGPVYSGSRYPAEYQGDVFVGDFVRGWIKRLDVSSTDEVTAVHDFGTNIGGPTDIQEDPNGNIAFADIYEGAVKHVAFGNAAPTARASASPASGPLPLTVAFRGDTSSDPDNRTLQYDWDFGDGSAHATTANPSHTYQRAGTYTAELTVTSPGGARDTATVEIQAGQAPSVSITSPASTLKYRGQKAVALSGSASDAEDGALAGSALEWEVRLHHNTHVHTFTSMSGASASFTPVKDHDADSFYEIKLTATDSDGLTTTETVNIHPETVKFTLNSSPPGAPVTYGGESGTAPLSQESAVGFRPSISAAPEFVSGGKTYRFKRWSDGGARAHDVNVPTAPDALLAIYEPVGSETLSFTPSGDTWVSSSYPTKNYGTGRSMTVAGGASVRQAFARFPVSGLAGKRIVGARLVTFALNPAITTGGEIFRTTSDWTETGTDHTTRPSLTTTRYGKFGPVRAHEWFEAKLGDGAVADGDTALAIKSPSTDGTIYATREARQKPLLLVDVATSTETLTFRPSADTKVSAEEPDTAFGTSSLLDVDASPQKISYLRFPVTGIGGRTVLSAKLRMFQRNSASIGGLVRTISSNAWTEATTYNTRPAIDGPQVGAFGAVAVGQWYETALADGAVTGDGDRSFSMTSTSSDGAYWGSRDSPEPPELIVTVRAD